MINLGISNFFEKFPGSGYPEKPSSVADHLGFLILCHMCHFLYFNPSVPVAPIWRISVFEKRLHETET